MFNIRNFIRNFLKRQNITLLGPEGTQLFFPDFDRVIRTLLPESHPIVFDVGANEGQTIKRVSRIFRNPKIYAFEPIPELVKKLHKEFSDDVISGNLVLVNSACGNVNSQSDFYVNAVSGHSSLLSLNPNSEWLKRRSGEKLLKTGEYTKELIKVKVITLDDFTNMEGVEHINFLKLDTQGSEINVLHGAKNLLLKGKIDVIQTELIHSDIYESSTKFEELQSMFSSVDYRLVAVSNGGSLVSSYMFQQDLLYASPSILSRYKSEQH